MVCALQIDEGFLAIVYNKFGLYIEVSCREIIILEGPLTCYA